MNFERKMMAALLGAASLLTITPAIAKDVVIHAGTLIDGASTWRRFHASP